MAKRAKKNPVMPHFSSYEEEVAWWDKHGPSMDDGDESEWEELTPSPNGRSIFADDPELDRQRAEVAKRDAEEERVRSLVRTAVIKTAKALAPRAATARVEEVVEDVTQAALKSGALRARRYQVTTPAPRKPRSRVA